MRDVHTEVRTDADVYNSGLFLRRGGGIRYLGYYATRSCNIPCAWEVVGGRYDRTAHRPIKSLAALWVSSNRRAAVPCGCSGNFMDLSRIPRWRKGDDEPPLFLFFFSKDYFPLLFSLSFSVKICCPLIYNTPRTLVDL